MAKPPNVIRTPNPLRAKVGSGFSGIDANAIAKAEEALKAMSAQFGQWLDDEVAKLDRAGADIRSRGYTPETAETLYFRAHDLKGLGATYEYPLVTRIAASLCRMLDDADKRMQAPLPVVEAHIDAIKAVVRDKIQTDQHPVGLDLAQTLEDRVAEHLG